MKLIIMINTKGRKPVIRHGGGDDDDDDDEGDKVKMSLCFN
jgi:hypothetical protein